MNANNFYQEEFGPHNKMHSALAMIRFAEAYHQHKLSEIIEDDDKLTDAFQLNASEQIFSHSLMTQNDFKKAILNLLKEE